MIRRNPFAILAAIAALDATREQRPRVLVVDDPAPPEPPKLAAFEALYGGGSRVIDYDRAARASRRTVRDAEALWRETALGGCVRDRVVGVDPGPSPDYSAIELRVLGSLSRTQVRRMHGLPLTDEDKRKITAAQEKRARRAAKRRG